MGKHLILVLAFIAVDLWAADVTCELRFEGTVDVPRSCVLATKPASAVTSRTAKIVPRRTSLQAEANPFVAEVGLDMSKMLFTWVKDAWSGNSAVKTGQLVTLSGGEPVSTVDLFDARIVELKVPTLDANSKDPLYFGIKFQPASIRYRSGLNLGGTKSGSKEGVSKMKSTLVSNFKVEIAGLPTDFVVKVGTFTWMAPVPDPRRGGSSPVSFPNVVLTIMMNDWDEWADWVNEFVALGSTNLEQEKVGHIAFLSNDTNRELGRVSLEGIVPMSIRTSTLEANAASFAKFEVELGVSGMKFYRP